MVNTKIRLIIFFATKDEEALYRCLFNLYADHIMRNAGLYETQAGIKIARRNISNLRYADGTTLMAESEEKLKKPLDESEREE